MTSNSLAENEEHDIPSRGGGGGGGGGGGYSVRFRIGMLSTFRRLETLQG